MDTAGGSEGVEHRVRRFVAIALPVVAIAMAVYQLAFTQYLIQSPTGHRITHLGFALVVVCLIFLSKSKSIRDSLFAVVILIISLVVVCFLMVNLDDILVNRQLAPLTSDFVIGALGIFLAFAVSYLIFGLSFPLLGLVLILYVYFGRYLPYPFTTADVPIGRIITWLSVPGIQEGMYGDILAISSNYLFLFIFFGSILQAFGGLRFVMAISQWVGSRLKAGPAIVALFGSSLLGTLTGSTVANVTITGSFTIPLMKKAGYKSEQAGAIEAVSSNGGQIMPPIMGATAFIMAGFAGIPYFNIMIAAIMPALLYYFGVFLYVILAAKRLNIKPVLKPINTRELLLDAPLFFIPLAVLVYFLFNGYSLPYVGFWSIISVVVLGLLSNVRKDINLTWRTVLKDMIGGVRVGSEMAVVCALIAIIATCIKVSGLGIKLPIVINDISGGHLIIALFIALFASTLLGMGVPTPVAYILVAIGVVPALESMGVSLIQAHFFCFIGAVFSHITPPIAVGALIASRIAIARFWPTCWEAVKAGITAFLLPFFVIYVPMIVLKPGEDLLFQSTQIMAIVCGLFSLQVFLSNSCFSFLKVHERVIFLISALSCVVFVFVQTYYLFLIGAILLAIGLARQLMTRGVPAPE